MGRSHALACHQIEDFEICGIVTRSPGSRSALNEGLGGGCAEFGDFYEALKETEPDAVSISTYPDRHAEFALAACESGADVFIEKPWPRPSRKLNRLWLRRSKPVRASGLGARLSDKLPEGKINYGHLQVTFTDGSVGDDDERDRFLCERRCRS